MLSIYDSSTKLCDGLTRREILRAGATGLFSLPLLGRQAIASESNLPAKVKNCIVLFLMGGPAQHSTWDPKPEAPVEVRGEFGPIATSVPGIQISELMPQTARLMDRVALLRAVVTNDNAHSSSGYAMLTGVPHAPLNQENVNPGAPNNWPMMGAVVQHLHQEPQVLPTSVRLPHHIFNTDQSVWPGQDAGWLGHQADPWLFKCQPADANFDVPQFRLQSDMSLGRLENRQTLLKQLESKLRTNDRLKTIETYSEQQQQAFELLSSPRARAACDLNQESEQTRERYGRGQFGQSTLLARRLIEAGTKFVQVNWFRGPDEPMANPCWDSHADEPKRLKNVLVPPFDHTYSALLEDLERRGLLEETLVVVMAEFGRSPRLDSRGGRGHWGYVFSIALAGAGIRGGTVHGESDAHAAYPRSGRVEPKDISATIFQTLGYHPETLIHDPLKRPHPLSRGRVIEEIL